MVPVKSRALFWLPLAFILLLGGCLGSSGEQAADADSTATAQADSTGDEKAPQKEKAIRVNVGEVRLGDLVQSVYADGAISTPKSVEMKTKVGGEFTTVNVRDGDHVRRGQVLARIDPREYEIALRESRYKHLQALSQMAAEDDTFVVNDRALSDFADLRDELQTLRSKGGITEDEYTARLLALEMGALNKGAFRDAVFEQRTGLADARMAEERARLNLENTEIKAPFSAAFWIAGADLLDWRPGQRHHRPVQKVGHHRGRHGDHQRRRDGDDASDTGGGCDHGSRAPVDERPRRSAPSPERRRAPWRAARASQLPRTPAEGATGPIPPAGSFR